MNGKNNELSWYGIGDTLTITMMYGKTNGIWYQRQSDNKFRAIGFEMGKKDG